MMTDSVAAESDPNIPIIFSNHIIFITESVQCERQRGGSSEAGSAHSTIMCKKKRPNVTLSLAGQ